MAVEIIKLDLKIKGEDVNLPFAFCSFELSNLIGEPSKRTKLLTHRSPDLNNRDVACSFGGYS